MSQLACSIPASRKLLARCAAAIAVAIAAAACANAAPSRGGDGAVDTATDAVTPQLDAPSPDATPGIDAPGDDDAFDAADGGACPAAADVIAAQPLPSCRDCAAAHCCAEATAMEREPDYAALLACQRACVGPMGADLACLNGCSATHPAGLTVLRAYSRCFQTDCARCDGSPAPQPYLTMAHLAVGVGAVDLCVRASGETAFRAPAFGATLPGGLGAGQSFAGWVPLGAPGSFDVRVVRAGERCEDDTARVAALASPLVAASVSDRFQLVLFGDASVPGASPALAVIPPDPASSALTTLRMRVFHAAAGEGELSAWQSDGTTTRTLVDRAAYGAVGTGGVVDANGYAAVAGFMPQVYFGTAGSAAALATLPSAAPDGVHVTPVTVYLWRPDRARPLAAVTCTGTAASMVRACR